MASAVLLKKDVRLDVPSVAPFLAEALQVQVHDARLVVRKARGIFQEHLEDGRARATGAALGKLGIETTVVPQAEIPPAPHMRRVFGGRFDADGIDLVLNPLRKPTRLPWADVHFVSIGVVATPQYEEYLTSKAFKSLPPIHSLEDEEAKAELRSKLASRALRRGDREGAGVLERARVRPKLDKKELEALYRDQTTTHTDLWTYGAGVRYRISRQDFNYECLGPRARKVSTENFRMLMNELWSRTPKALYTRMSKEFLSGSEVHEILFDSLEEFDKSTRWFLHEAAGPAPKPGVVLAGADEDLLGPALSALIDSVETVE